MAYVALYREWRPKAFADIVGQEHICKTLQNAIEVGRIAHAYLFCGPRGTGKTSTAKVLAKALNCLDKSTNEPCNQCDNCKRINEGTSYDVIEIDAASNRGIDEIRDLREKVKYAPAEGKFKIYIIDEVHMLTTEAFNALLKTLEEPPKHVIFVLATTEPHKIPLTILSRCQRFDFRRIGLQDTINRLVHICQHENIDISEEALRIIAKRAEGGMRDALSILDQCISFSGKTISAEDITTILGTVNEVMLQKISSAIIDNNVTLCLQLVDEMLKEGKDARQFIKDLIEYFRNVLLVQVCDQVDGLVNVSDSSLELLKNQARQISKARILNTIDTLTDQEKEMKWTTQPRLMLEVGVIKVCQSEKDITDQQALHTRSTMLKDEAREKNVSKPTNIKVVNEEPKDVADPVKAALKADKPEDTNKIKEIWLATINALKKEKKMRISAFMMEGQPVVINDKTLIIEFKEEHAFHKEQIEMPANKADVEKVLRQVAGAELIIKCVMASETGSAVQKESSPQQNPLVQEAIKVFGGDVIEINE